MICYVVFYFDVLDLDTDLEDFFPLFDTTLPNSWITSSGKKKKSLPSLSNDIFISYDMDKEMDKEAVSRNEVSIVDGDLFDAL